MIISAWFFVQAWTAVASAATCPDLFIVNSQVADDAPFLREHEVIVLIDHVSASHKVLSRSKIRREISDGATKKFEVTADFGTTKVFDSAFVYTAIPQRRVSAIITDLSATERAAAEQPNLLLVASRRLPSRAGDADAPIQYVGLLPNGRLVNVIEILEELN